MRRTLQPLLAVAGLSLLLAACSGESPTSPKPPSNGGNGGGACTVTVALDATSVTPMAGTAIIIRATVKKGGVAVPDGTSVTFTTDFGYFLETGLPSVSKVTQNGFADVTLGATSSGLSKVKAAFECGTAEKSIEYQPVPSNGPFISSINPTSGSCAGGDTVTINGGRFGTDAAGVRVLFGGKPASVQTVSDTRLVVLTPDRTLANPQVPEAVDVVIQFFVGDVPTGLVTAAKGFTYYCVDPSRRMTVTGISPSSGSPDGGQQVQITGTNFLPSATSSAATTRVTFGGAPASVVTVTNTQITVLTPRHILANPAVPETVDVAVLVDLGLVSQQTGLLPQSYTYRAGGGAGTCNGTPGLFIATVKPDLADNAGNPDGGDLVVISGGGFLAGNTSSTTEEIRAHTFVFFGGNPGTTISVSDYEIRVSTPRRVLASPDRPETVDVRVIVDAGGPKEGCAEAAGAYTYYPGGFLEPVITSISPSTGPNDASTRVTMFGRNFKLPMQVFVGGVEAAVVEIKASQIIFLTPQATGPNSALAGTSATVEVRDPYSGKSFSSPVLFRYYSCPTLNSVVPGLAPWNQSTVVTIAGQSFEEPVEITFTSAGLQFRPTVTSVSSSLITLVMPPIDPGAGGSAACGGIVGTLDIAFPAITCTALSSPFTYSVNPMTATSATPTQLNQAGGPYGSVITSAPATITVVGTNFIDPMTVTLIKGGSPVLATSVNNAIVSNSSQLSFTAPPVPDSALNEQSCVPAGGATLTGRAYVPTSFGIRLTNARTGCSVDLPNVLIYYPIDTACRTAISVTGTAPATATLCTAYGPANFAVAGGGPPYTTVDLLNGPAGIDVFPATLAAPGSVSISGTPVLLATGPGQASTAYNATLVVVDSSPSSADASVPVPITVIDPGAPFAVTGSTAWAVGAAASSLPLAVSPATTPYPVTWTVVGALPAGVTLNATGNTATLDVAASLVPGSTPPLSNFSVTVRATDLTCAGSANHTNTITVTGTVTGR